MPADDVRAAKAAYEATIFARANVVGVAIGNKMIRGRETDERCIVVFVEAKKPEAQLRHRDLPTAVACKTRLRASLISSRSSSRSGSPDRSRGSWLDCSGPSSAPRAGG